jgi:serine/threonine protein kinase
MESTGITEIGRYKVDREIGSGGMALAYRCVLEGPSGFQKFVLLKMLHPDHRESSHYYGMFLDEARLCARLQHPNIPQVFELGEHEDLPFMVMEYIDGPNLVLLHRKFRDGHRRHWGNLALIFEKVARALHHAHTLRDAEGKPLKIVHRDVSLANVLVGRDGHPKLIDFGIAKWEQSETVTEVDVLKGKLRYMAPEQFQKGDLDGRVDIYQLGVAMYWLFTGRPPFGNASGVQELQARFQSMPARPSSIVHGFPPALEKIILRCLEPRPDRRFQTAQEAAEALEGFVRSDPAYAASEATLSTWLQELFPPGELEAYQTRAATGTVAAGRGHTGTVAKTNSEGGNVPPNLPPAPSRDDSLTFTQLLGLAAVIVVTTVATTLYIKSSNQRAGSDVEGLLDHAQAALEEKNLILARKLLLRAGRVDDVEPDVEERLTELEVELERVKTVEEARRALAMGNVEGAKMALSKLLAEMPNDPEANQLLQHVQARGAAPVPPWGGPPPPPSPVPTP